jgi:hypothetical protein
MEIRTSKEIEKIIVKYWNQEEIKNVIDLVDKLKAESRDFECCLELLDRILKELD